MRTDPASSLESLVILLPILEEINVWLVEDIFAACSTKAKELGVKNGNLLYPLGIALAGTRSTPGGGTDLCIILGKEKALARISFAISNLSKYGNT